MKQLNDMPLLDRKYALTAGIGLIIMAIAAGFSYGFVLRKLVIDGNVIATLENIQSSITLFTAGIIGWYVILILDIVVALSLYKLLAKFSKHLALVGAGLRLLYSGILGISILNLIFILIITSTEFSPQLPINQLQALVMLFLNVFHMVWSIGLIFFGGHLMIISYITIKSNILPKVIGLLLFLAGISYIIIHFNLTFLPNLNEVTRILESYLSIPMFLGEISFAIWLLVKGGKNSSKMQNR